MARPDNTQTPPTGANPQESTPKKRNLLLIAIAAAVLLVGVSVGVTVTVLKKFSTADASATSVDTATDLTNAPAIYYPLSPAFVVNFQHKGRTRFLQVDLTILLRNEKILPLLDTHMPLIRNQLVLLLSSQEFETLQTAEGKESLRQQALARIQDVLRGEMVRPDIEQVLYTSFVMQ